MTRSSFATVRQPDAVAVAAADGALDPSYPEERIEFMLRDSFASIVIARPELAGTLAAAASAR